MNCHSGKKTAPVCPVPFQMRFPQFLLFHLWFRSRRIWDCVHFSWVAQNLNHLSNFLISIASQCVRMIFAMCKNDKRLHFASAGCQFFLLLYQLLHTKQKDIKTQKHKTQIHKKTNTFYKCRPSTCGFDTDSSHYDEGPNKIPQLYISSYFHNSSLLCLNFPQLQLRKI